MTESSTCDLSVVIVNWNAREFLGPCLDSIFNAPARTGDAGFSADGEGDRAGGLRLEVCVVDNASTDASVRMIRERYPQVHVIVNAENQGFAAANNQALALAKGRYAILLNPDTEVSPGALSRMVRFLDEHPQAAVVGPRLVVRRGHIQGGAAGYEPSPWTVFNYSFFLYKLAPRVFRGLWLAKRQYRSAEPIPVDWVSGAALMVRMAAARQAGPLSEDYFMYAEDWEWCRRLRKAGWHVYCLPDVQVLHHIGRSARQRGPAFFATNVHSLDRYYRSHFRPATVWLLHLFGTGGFLLRTLAYAALYMTRGKMVYAELRDQWWACTRAGLGHLIGQTSASEVKRDARRHMDEGEEQALPPYPGRTP